MNGFGAPRYYNIQAVCLIRLVEMAMRTPSSTGAGMKAFIDSFDEALSEKKRPLVGGQRQSFCCIYAVFWA